MAQRSDRLALMAFAGYSILGGGNAVGVRFSNQELDPFWGATLRFGLAALLMLVVMFATGHRLPTGRALLGASLYGLLAFGGAFAFAFYALVELEAGFGQILLSVVPLVTLLLAVLQRLERLRRSAVVGALLAVTGVVLMSGLTLEGPVPLLAIGAAFGAAICFAQASIVVKRFPPVHPIVENAVGMTVGAIFLAALTLVSGDQVVLPERSDTWLAVVYMVVIGSGVVFTLYVVVLEHWDASRASYGFVIVPIVTVLVSAWLLDEQLGYGLIGGGALVLAGVYFGALRPSHTPKSQPDVEHV
jgi:drug/metabolite transporter (DMT)-like permease